MRGDYIVVGDTEKHKDCLICLCSSNKKHAEQVLERMKNNPTDNDLKLIDGAVNLRIKLVNPDDCWWRYGCD